MYKVFLVSGDQISVHFWFPDSQTIFLIINGTFWVTHNPLEKLLRWVKYHQVYRNVVELNKTREVFYSFLNLISRILGFEIIQSRLVRYTITLLHCTPLQIHPPC